MLEKLFKKSKNGYKVNMNVDIINIVNNSFAKFEFDLNELKGKNNERNPNRMIVNKVISDYQDIILSIFKNDFERFFHIIFERFNISLKDKMIWGEDKKKSNYQEQTKEKLDILQLEVAKLHKKLVDHIDDDIDQIDSSIDEDKSKIIEKETE